MKKSTKLDQLLEGLQDLRHDPGRAGGTDLLRKALRGNSGYAAANAAVIIGESGGSRGRVHNSHNSYV